MKLDDPYINFIIISAYKDNCEDVDNRLSYSKLYDSLIFKDFSVVEMGGNQPSLLAYKECDNNEIRYDAIELMDNYSQEHVIVKYKNETEAKKIFFDGRESLLGLVRYDGNTDNHNFFVEGNVFSFANKKRYNTPTKISDFKKGMVVEVKNNNGDWVSMSVKDPEVEYHRVFKVMIKYDKIRIESIY